MLVFCKAALQASVYSWDDVLSRPGDTVVWLNRCPCPSMASKVTLVTFSVYHIIQVNTDHIDTDHDTELLTMILLTKVTMILTWYWPRCWPWYWHITDHDTDQDTDMILTNILTMILTWFWVTDHDTVTRQDTDHICLQQRDCALVIIKAI